MKDSPEDVYGISGANLIKLLQSFITNYISNECACICIMVYCILYQPINRSDSILLLVEKHLCTEH